MAFEILPVLMGACFAAVVVLYASLLHDYIGHAKKGTLSAGTIPVQATHALTMEQIIETPAVMTLAEAVPATADPASTSAPALYETVQPIPSTPPVAFPMASAAAFGTLKPARTYRRRIAPLRKWTPGTNDPWASRMKKTEKDRDGPKPKKR